MPPDAKMKLENGPMIRTYRPCLRFTQNDKKLRKAHFIAIFGVSVVAGTVRFELTARGFGVDVEKH